MRILVTRAAEDAGRTAQRLEAMGHDAVIAPVTRIAPTGDPRPSGIWDALIVTSLHAEEALRTLEDRSLPVFAVGERTAAAVRGAGFGTVAVAEGDAVSLSALVRDRLPPGRTLLHVTARHHKDEPALSLRAAGFRVVQWEAYEARAAERLPEAAVAALRAGRIDAVLHYSRRSADLFLRLAGEAGLSPFLSGPVHVCLSADVADPLEALGLPVRLARRPEEDALLAAVPAALR